MGLWSVIRRLTASAPVADNGPLAVPAGVDDAKPTATQLKQVADGGIDPTGYHADGEALRRSADQRHGQPVVGSTIAATMLHQRDRGLVRPRREAYKSDAAFDAAYLAYQDARLAELAHQFPLARFSTPICHGTNFSPEELKASDGLPRKGGGDNFSLREHQREFTDPEHPEKSSALRGGCQDMRIPAGMAGEGGYVYELIPRGGALSLMDALGHDDLLPAELELVFGARQPWHRIKGWRRVGAYSDVHGSFRLGPFVANPDFDPNR